MQHEFVAADVHGVSGVRAALIAGDDGDVATEHIDDLAFSFIAPLRADYHQAIRFHALRLAQGAASYKLRRFLAQEGKRVSQQSHGGVDAGARHVTGMIRTLVHAP